MRTRSGQLVSRIADSAVVLRQVGDPLERRVEVRRAPCDVPDASRLAVETGLPLADARQLVLTVGSYARALQVVGLACASSVDPTWLGDAVRSIMSDEARAAQAARASLR